jgi:hypothetical protein
LASTVCINPQTNFRSVKTDQQHIRLKGKINTKLDSKHP